MQKAPGKQECPAFSLSSWKKNPAALKTGRTWSAGGALLTLVLFLAFFAQSVLPVTVGGWQGPCLSPSRHLGAFYEERCNRDILGSWVPLRGIWPRSAVRPLRWFCQAKASGCQADPDPKGFKLQDPRWSGWMCPAPYTAAWAVLTHPPHNRTHP